MKEVIQNLSDITDSKEMLEAKPKRFTIIFIYFLIILLLSSFIFTYFGEIDIVIKANGIVRPTESVRNVKNKVLGMVKELHIKDGRQVSEGDILYIINHDNLLVERNLVAADLALLKKEESNLNKLKESIEKEENLFDKDNKDEIDYYFKYVKYSVAQISLNLQKEKSTAENYQAQRDNNLIANNSRFKLDEVSEYTNGLNLLKQSIIQNKNLFSEQDSVYYKKYLDYSNKVKQYEMDVEKKKIFIDDIQGKNVDNKKSIEEELSAAKHSLQASKLELEDYDLKYTQSIYEAINKNNSLLDQITYDKKSSKLKDSSIDTDLYYLNLLKESIESGVNRFNKNLNESDLYKEYLSLYNNYLKELSNNKDNEASFKQQYLNELNKKIRSFGDSSDLINTDLASKNAKEDEIEEENTNLTKLINSIKQNKNLFSETNKEYYFKYEQYKTSREKLSNDVKTKSALVESVGRKIKAFDDTSKNQLKDVHIDLENSTNILNSFKNSYLLEIDTSLKENDNLVADYKLAIDKSNTNDLHSIIDKYNINSIESYKADTIVTIDDSLKTNENNIKQLEKKLESVNLNIEDCIVKAPTSGIVNVVKELNENELVESGIKIATIISSKDDYYNIELFVPNKDIAKLKSGNEIKYNFHALPYKEYGYLKGEITSISVDSKIDTQLGVNYYLAKSTLKNTPVYSYKGVRSEIKVGMTCEAQVITEKKKILYFLLEKLNLKD